MLFTSRLFLVCFLPVVLLVYYGILFRWRNAQNIFLLLMSLLFYACGEPWFVFIMIVSIMLNYVFGLLMDSWRENSRCAMLILVLSLFINLGILGYFKYWIFILGNIQHFTNSYIPIPEITLPIGISFFTFQEISYIMDIYRGICKAQKNPLDMGLYIAFFPQLIAGPIVRYETIAEQIHHRKETFDDFSDGVCRFILGLGKKMLLANQIAMVSENAFRQNTLGGVGDGELTVVMAWMGAIAFTFQIYFDFSGYSDMAIGLGKMFGFHFPENFRYPYVSTSVSEFWRRWHISLSSFFRDYVYIPLGGNRVSSGRLIVNLFIVWSLTGLWHGANWTFVAWGLFFFVLLVFEKYSRLEQCFVSWWLRPIRYLYTMLCVVVGWVLFNSPSIQAAGRYLTTMFGFSENVLINDQAWMFLHETFFIFLLGALFSFPLVPWLKTFADKSPVMQVVSAILYCGVFVVSFACVLRSAMNPFLYFNF